MTTGSDGTLRGCRAPGETMTRWLLLTSLAVVAVVLVACSNDGDTGAVPEGWTEYGANASGKLTAHLRRADRPGSIPLLAHELQAIGGIGHNGLHRHPLRRERAHRLQCVGVNNPDAHAARRPTDISVAPAARGAPADDADEDDEDEEGRRE